ncbi:MAG: NAD-dependent epimerase/dehydratase family protein [Thiobacillus sp.]
MGEAISNPADDVADPARSRPLVLLTGATGFLGRALSAALAAAGYRLVGLDRTPKKLAHAESLRCDLTSDESVDAALREVKQRHGTHVAAVVHLAGYYDFSGEADPFYRAVNVDGTRRLLQALQAFEVEQFVYASTLLVHAPTTPGVPIDESSPLAPRWAYPQSKLDTEAVVAAAHGAIPYVLLRIAGVYTSAVQPPTLAHQICWIYERRLEARLFPGETSHGQSFIHIDDLCDALVRLVQQRASLPPDLALLAGEPVSLSYDATQNRLGTLIHGEHWQAETLPKPLAKAGAVLQRTLETVVPDSLDRGEKPFVKPFMVELADDHYELDVSRAHALLGWTPRPSLRDELPGIVAALKADPLAWYRPNKIPPPEWLETLAEHPDDAHTLRENAEKTVRRQHAQISGRIFSTSPWACGS